MQKVTTAKFGDIIGFTEKVKFGNQTLQVRKFLGIPCAEPPTGNLRFEKPVMKTRLHTPFEALNYSSKCPQPQLEYGTMSEDCLYLNIFTPSDSSSTNVAPKPVMIWIHCGAFIEGYSDIYAGDIISSLADVIVVPLNYRLAFTEFAQSLGCSDLSSKSACLKSKAEADVISATLKIESRIINEVNRSWVPVFDDEFVLAKTPDILSELLDPNLRSKYSNFWDVDLMICANNYDGVVYQDLMMVYINNTTPTSISYNVTAQNFDNIIVPRAIEAWLGKIPTPFAQFLTIDEYTIWNDPFNTTMRLHNMIDILTDYAINAPSISTARAHLNDNSSTYVYQFSAAPPKRLLHLAPVLEGSNVACHTDELPFVFGFTENLRRYWNFSESIIKPNDYQLARAMITMWTNFAKSGNPNVPLQLGASYNVYWPGYDIFGEQYLEIAPELFEVKHHLRAEQEVFWNYLLPEIQTFGNRKRR